MKVFRLPLLLFGLPALLIAFAGHRAGWLVYDRAALARGECWRLWTGHWVHFSGSHLGWNLLAIVAAGAWLEHARPGWLLRHTLVAAPLISLALFATEPRMQVYGGLSALATSVVTLLALVQRHAGRADRTLWSALLVVVAAKVGWDLTHTVPLFSRFASPDVRPSVFAHAAGVAAALLLRPVWARAWRARRRPATEKEAAGTRDGFPAARFR